MKRAQMRRRAPRRPAMTTATREAVRARDGGVCVSCGLPLPAVWECHHRKLRSRGGTDDPSNLLALHDICHQDVHSLSLVSTTLGYLVSSWHDPAASPVLVVGAGWFTLNPDGSRTACAAPEQAA